MLSYGFFNAVKDEETNEYDRVYSNEDFTTFFEGIINQNGIFKNIENQFEIEIPSGTDRLAINVRPGKALIFGHWCRITSDEALELEPPGLAYDRIDAIDLTLNVNSRIIYLEQIKGANYDDGSKIITPYVPQKGFDESTKTFYITDSGECSIRLGYILMKKGSISNSGLSVVGNLVVGSSRCPWISYMPYDPHDGYTKNVDAYLKAYFDKFTNWFREVQDTLQINTDVVNIEIYATGSSSSIPLEAEDYVYSSGDVIKVFCNGLLMTKNREWFLDSTSTPPQIIFQEQRSGLSEIVVSITKGTPMTLPSGDDIKY